MPASARADAGQQQRVTRGVDAEGRGDRRVLGQRAQRLAEIGVAQRRPDAAKRAGQREHAA